MTHQKISMDDLNKYGIIENMELNLPSMNLSEFLREDQEKYNSYLSKSAKVSIMNLASECEELLKTEWIKDKIKNRWLSESLEKIVPFSF